jgi:hypothetical protein
MQSRAEIPHPDPIPADHQPMQAGTNSVSAKPAKRILRLGPHRARPPSWRDTAIPSDTRVLASACSAGRSGQHVKRRPRG